jgi:hypothetical protein
MFYQSLGIYLIRIFLLSISIGFGTLLPLARANAAETLSDDRQALLLKALSAATFANSPPTTEDITYTADPRIPQIPSFAYTKGTPLAEAMPAAVVMLMGADKYTPITATQAAGDDPTTLANSTLTSLPFIGKLPFAATLAANPQLKNLNVRDVFPTWTALPNATLGDIASSAAGKLPVPADILANTPIANLPGITTTPFSNYPGIGKPDLPGIPSIDRTAKLLGLDGVKVGDLPGIPNLPWSKLIVIGNIPSTLMVMKFDKLNSGQNNISVANGSKIASGSNKEPNAPCKGTCDAVELLSVFDPQNNLNPFNGSLSIIGQRLKGGYGLVGDLMTAAGIREPAGFEVPYIGINGCGSKWSAESPNAQAGTIQQQLNLRFCYSIPFLGFQASPYFIPLPLPLPTSEQQANILLPMSISPVVIIKPPVPTIPTIPAIARIPNSTTSPILGDRPQLSIAAVANNADKVALFGNATKKAYSPSLGISLNNA